MAKFFRLVKNEYIKTLKKISTLIMLISIIVLALGLGGLVYLENLDFGIASVGLEEQTDFNDQIDWLNKTKEEGYESEIKFYEYLNEKKVKPDSMQADLAISAYDILPETTLYSAIDKLIDDNDWRAFCHIMKDNTKGAVQWEYAYRLDNDIPFGEVWQDDEIFTVSNAKISLEEMDKNNSGTSQQRAECEQDELLGLYRLENNISFDASQAQPSYSDLADELVADNNFWSVMFQSTSLISLIGLLVIIIAGSCVANEFAQGTIKFLLINPVKRWKILMSKYFMVITFGYLMLALLYVVMIPVAGLFTGFKELGAPYLYVSNGTVHEISPFLEVAKMYLLDSVNIVVMATMAFALSSLFKSAALAIGTGVACMFAGSSLVSILAMLNQDWARYLIFANTNLGSIYNGESYFPNHTVTFAAIVIIVHMIIFLLTAWDGFTKREC